MGTLAIRLSRVLSLLGEIRGEPGMKPNAARTQKRKYSAQDLPRNSMLLTTVMTEAPRQLGTKPRCSTSYLQQDCNERYLLETEDLNGQ